MVIPLAKPGSYGESRQVINPNHQAFCCYELKLVIEAPNEKIEMTDQDQEVTPVRSNSPELAAMSLPKLKEVAAQLGIDGAAKLDRTKIDV